MSPYTRRTLLRSAGVLALSGAAATVVSATVPIEGAAAREATGFLHGVASGDPLPDSILLWTRLTPSRDATPGSGRGTPTRVAWEIAEDSGFRRIAARGTVMSSPDSDHTIKVIAGGLSAGKAYWYRFMSGAAASVVGRTKTAPAAGSTVHRLRLGVVSCANYQAGYFTAYRHLADRGDLDVVLHLGDYLYEYAPGGYQARDIVVRPHDPATEITTLSDYRRRHAQYKTDEDLQALHASVAFIATWDDHESANDSWSGGAQNHTEGAEGLWVDRKRFSQQAYAEWMPVRYELGGHLYRDFAFGSLANVSMLDLRSYRSEQASSPADPAIKDPARTITGQAQMDWLLAGLSSTATQWKLVGNPVMITPVRFPSTLNTEQLAGLSTLLGGETTLDGVPYNIDQWDGYTADRSRVIGHLRDNGIKDTVFLTGDIHSGWANDLPADPLTYPVTGASVAVELVGTSVTSDNLDDILKVPPHTGSRAVEAAFQAANPHVKYLDFDSHGYSVLDVTAAGVTMDWFVLSDRTDPASGSSLSTSWRVPAGAQKVERVGGIL